VNTRRTPLWGLMALAAIAVAYQLPFFDRAMFLMDEGHILQFADIVANGGELYRDATLLPLPGSFYLLSAAFDWFGPSIRLARWIAVIEFALLCVFAFLVLQRLTSPRIAALGLLWIFLYRIWAFPHWHMYSYSSMAQCLLAASLVAMLRFFASDDRRILALAGFGTGLAVFCKQDYGVAGLLAFNATLLIRHATAPRESNARGLASFVAYNTPAVAVGAAVALHFLRQGLFGEMLQQTLLNHLVGIASFEYSSLPPLFPLFAQEPLFREPYGYAVYIPSIVFQVDWDLLRGSGFYNDTYGWDVAIKSYFFAPYAIVGLAVGRLVWTRHRARDPERRAGYLSEAALVALGTSSLLALNKPVDYVHVAVFYWTLLLIVAALLDALVRDRRRLGVALAVVFLLPGLAAVGYTGRLALRLADLYQTPLRTERAGVFVLPDEEHVIGEAIDWVREHSSADEPFPVLPYFPLVSFLADRDGPHRTTYTFWPIEYIPNRQREIIDAIEASPNDRLLYHFTQFVVFPRMSEFAPELFAYLVDRYETERVFTSQDWGYMLAGARRSSGPPAGVPILDFSDPDVAISVEDDAGNIRAVTRARRSELFGTELWPFRPVFEQRPLSGGRRSIVALEVDVPTNATLETAVSVHPERWFNHPPSSVSFELRVLDGEQRETLHRQTIRPQQDWRDRRWFPWRVPLARFAGRRVRLEFTASCERANGEQRRMGGWEIPRLVTQPVPAAPLAPGVTP
jgi:hypothetical protein